jgi:intein/homing endonuclease
MEIVNRTDFIQTYRDRSIAEKEAKRVAKILPLKPSASLACIVAAINTDGHLQKRRRYHSYQYVNFWYFSDDPELIKTFEKHLERIFRVSGKTRRHGHRKNGRSTGIVVVNAPIARLLELVGVVPGNKVRMAFRVPGWVKKSNKQIKAGFLRTLFTCEGSIGFDVRQKRWELRFYTSKDVALSKNALQYIHDIQQLLEELGVRKSIITKYTRKGRLNVVEYTLKIYDKQSLLNFANWIGFDSFKKRRRLREAELNLDQRAGK